MRISPDHVDWIGDRDPKRILGTQRNSYFATGSIDNSEIVPAEGKYADASHARVALMAAVMSEDASHCELDRGISDHGFAGARSDRHETNHTPAGNDVHPPALAGVHAAG